MAETGSLTVYPGAYDASLSSLTGSGISNANNPVGKGPDNLVFANIHANNSVRPVYASWPFDVASIPRNAVIDSVVCNATASMSSVSSVSLASMQLYSGTVAKGNSVSFKSTVQSTYSINGQGWTREELASVCLRLTVDTSASQIRNARFYGADLTVTYTYQSEKFMLKLGGKYNDIARVFKKVSGIWVEQTELANVIEDGVRYKNGGEYVAPKKTVTIKGTGNSSNGYVTINGTKYTSAATVRVEGGTTVGITLDCDMYNLLCKVTLNGTVVHENSTTNAETYYHIVDSDCTITLASTGSGGGYKADIVTN